MSVDPSTLPYRDCVGVMLINAEGLVWLGHRMDGPAEPEGPGTWWQMPQGGIDKGEDPREAAFRELYEETSVRSAEVIGETAEWVRYELPHDLLGRAWKGRYRGQQQKWFAMRFTGEDAEINIADPGGGGHKPEFNAWKWVRASELTALVVPFKQDVYRQVVTELGSLAAG